MKGSFSLSVHCSEQVYLNALPEAFSQTIAGEWTDATAGGSHLAQSWKKNPKFSLNIRYPPHGEMSPRVRITLARCGEKVWKAMSRKDTVGCMIGFYVICILAVRTKEEVQAPHSTLLADFRSSGHIH